MKKLFLIFLILPLWFQSNAQIFIEGNMGTNNTQTGNFDYFVYDSQSFFSGVYLGYTYLQYSLRSGLAIKSVYYSKYNANVNYYSIPLDLIYESRGDIAIRLGLGYDLNIPYKYQQLTNNKYLVSSVNMIFGLKFKLSKQNSIFVDLQPYRDIVSSYESNILTHGLSISLGYQIKFLK